MGKITGLAETARIFELIKKSKPVFCKPYDITNQAVFDAVMAYIKIDKSADNIESSAVILRALETRFPCGKAVIKGAD